MAVVCAMAAVALFDLGSGLSAQSRKTEKKETKKDRFTRPEPRPIHPEVPSADRYRQDKIFLEYADSLYRINDRYDTVERQILKGDVKFRQAGMWMFCDSAYYYPQLNSLDAFGNVRMEQGDTLFVYADKLFYDGNSRLAKLKNGPSRDKVTLINNDVTLTTDSLDYDLDLDYGWYERWGTIDDKVNTLTSLFGQYSSSTKDADFYHDVVLVNNRDGYTLYTDTLFYNTDTHIARIESLAEIQSENDTIYTRRAIYDTEAGNADLLTRSMIVHRDSTGNIITMEGDSIVYDKASHISRAYMFRDQLKNSMPMVITDTAQKMTLIGGFGIYNDSTREALATDYPLLMEYSQGDTLFLRSDTIKTFIVTEMVPVKRKYGPSGYPERNGQPIIMADSTYLWIDNLFFSVSLPWIDLPLKMLNDAVPVSNSPNVDNGSDMVKAQPAFENSPLSLPLASNDVSSSDNGVIPELPLINDVLNYNNDGYDEISQDEFTAEQPVDTIEREPKDFHVALAYYRARFFKKDLQGVADSIVFIERDSMMYLFRKPIIWSGERQVTGNRIDVHFNDSTVDWAELPEQGMMSEHVDEDFYNQIAGKSMKAYFADETLKRLEVSGNVETIFLPQESDSTFNRLVAAESSYLDLEMDSGKMEKLKMWPEVSGTVTPIFLVKRNQMYLQKFRWWEALRPRRDWYGGRLVWEDNLGEVPDDLESYFLAPSEFGEPKTFSASRFIPPPTSLPIWDDTPAVEMEESDEFGEMLKEDMETMVDNIDEDIKEEGLEIDDGLLQHESHQTELMEQSEDETILEDKI